MVGIVDESVCSVVRNDDYAALDKKLGTDIVGKVLPNCYRLFLNSFDPRILNDRLAVGKFLASAENNATLNQVIRFEDTTWSFDIRNLTHLNPTENFTIFSPRSIQYIKDYNNFCNESGFYYDKLWRAQNDTKLGYVKYILRNVTECILGDISIQNADKDGLGKAQRHYTSFQSTVTSIKPASTSWLYTRDSYREAIRFSLNYQSEVMFIQEYYRSIPNLFRITVREALSQMMAKLFQGISKDVFRMRPLWDIYNFLLRHFACQQLVGISNAIWFFIGFYLIFTGFASLLIFYLTAALNGVMREQHGDFLHYWETKGRLYNHRNIHWTVNPIMDRSNIDDDDDEEEDETSYIATPQANVNPCYVGAEN